MNNHIKEIEKNGIDIFRLIFAVVVISAHTHPFENVESLLIQSIYTTIMQAAVPFFFLCIGYFLNKKYDREKDSQHRCSVLKEKIFEYSKLYLIYSAIYLPLAIIGYLKQNITVGRMIFFYFRDLLFAGEHYNSYHLWFLLSAVYAFIAIWLLKKYHFKIGTIVIVGAFFLLISLSEELAGCSSLFQAISNKMSALHINSRLLTGLFYIATGMCFKMNACDTRIAFPITIVSFIGCFYFRMIGNRLYLVFQILFVLFLFFTITILKTAYHPAVFHVMREMSKYVYFYHMWIWTILYALIFRGRTSGMLIFLCSTVVSLILSWIIVIIKNKRSKQNKTSA